MSAAAVRWGGVALIAGALGLVVYRLGSSSEMTIPSGPERHLASVRSLVAFGYVVQASGWIWLGSTLFEPEGEAGTVSSARR